MTFEGEQKINTESFLESKSKILGNNKFPNVLSVNIDIDDVSLFPSKYMNEEEIKEVRTISVSGFQHKIPALIERDTIRLPRADEEVFYFVKPFHPLKADEENKLYFPHMAINEHLHLTFAKNELGFDVPESGIFKTEEDREYHYIVKYFDRYRSYKFQRKEFSTYLGLSSDDKYKISSEKLFERASKVFSREEDRLKMLEYYFYSFVIRHEDMHTKNISSIIDKDKTVIAPLYDIATTGFYGGIKNYESHLTINGKQTNIRLKDFLCLVTKANVRHKVFMKRAKGILEAYLDKMPGYIEKIEKLDQIDFYIKERPNAQEKKIKIKECISLDKVMLAAYYNRVDTLEKNLWLEQLDIESQAKNSKKNS
jgi:serine/threonine-protein kinase HipA